MANIVDTILTITPRINGQTSEFDKLFADLERAVETFERAPICNLLKPMPPELNITSGSTERYWELESGRIPWEPWLEYEWVKPLLTDENRTLEGVLEIYAKQSPESKALAPRYAANFERFGHVSWYGWALEHWGTKWGDMNTEVTLVQPYVLIVTFESAWDTPRPILEALASRYPGVRISVQLSGEIDPETYELVPSTQLTA